MVGIGVALFAGLAIPIAVQMTSISLLPGPYWRGTSRACCGAIAETDISTKRSLRSMHWRRRSAVTMPAAIAPIIVTAICG